VCINLDRRPDRWERVQQEFARHGIGGVRRFPAIDGNALEVPTHWPDTRGAYGCLLSHLQVVREARARGLPNILIFEDDVTFDPGFRQNIHAFCEELPSDWDMVFFGAFHRHDPMPVSGRIGRITHANSTYAYALNHTIFDEFIDSNSRATLAVDENNVHLQAQFDCYAFIPNLAWVEPLYSDTQEGMCNHWYLRESLVLRGRLIGELIPQTLLVIAYDNRTANSIVEENLRYSLRKNRERLPDMAITVVEQGPTATIDPAALPSSVRYIWLPSEGPLNRGACYNLAVRSASPNKTILAFVDGNIFLREFDIRGNLAMCLRFDATTGVEEVIELSEKDTRLLKQNEVLLLRSLQTTACVAKKKPDAFSLCCFFHRRAFTDWGGWNEELPGTLALRQAERVGKRLRVFDTPCPALGMHQGN
jgi:GR25 family glycosyltransferase involved in LPS biosynthesis